VNRDEFKVLLFPDMHKDRTRGSKYIIAKDYVYNAMKRTGYSLRQIAIKAGVETESQFIVFLQVIEVADTYSNIFKSYRNAIRIVVKDYVRHKRNSEGRPKIHNMKSVRIE
jgi:capsule polysaccharide modification protein KpsS